MVPDSRNVIGRTKSSRISSFTEGCPDYDGMKVSEKLSELSNFEPRLYGKLVETCVNDLKLPKITFMREP